MAIDPKKLDIKYKDLLSISTINRYDMARSGVLNDVINALTPTQLALLFPDYYKRNLSQQGGVLSGALSGGYSGGVNTGGSASAVTPNSTVSIPKPSAGQLTPWMKELAKKHPEIVAPTPVPQQGQQNIQPSVSLPGQIAIDKKGNVNKADFFKTAVDKFRNSPLNGFVPKDGQRYGIDGTPESWAKFAMRTAQVESGFNINVTNMADEGGSRGLFQWGLHYGITEDNWRDPNAQLDAFVNYANTWTVNGGGYIAPPPGVQAKRYGSFGGFQAAFSTVRDDKVNSPNAVATADSLAQQYGQSQIAQQNVQTAPQTAALKSTFETDQSIAYLRQTGAFKENELKALFYKGGQDKLAQGIRDKLSGLPLTPPSSLIRKGWMKDERLKDLVEFANLTEADQLKQIENLEKQVAQAQQESSPQAQQIGPRQMPTGGLLEQAKPQHPETPTQVVPGSDIVLQDTGQRATELKQKLPPDLSGIDLNVLKDLSALSPEKLQQAYDIIRQNGVEATNKSYEQYGTIDPSQINATGFGVGKVHGQQAYSEKQLAERPTVGRGKMSFQGFDDEELKALSFDVGTGSSESYPSIPYGTYSLSEQGIGSTIAGYYAKGGLGTQGEYGTVFNVGTPQDPTATGFDPKAGRGRSEIQIHSNINSDIRRLTSMGCITPTREQYPQLVNGLRKAMKAAGGNVALVVESDGQGGQKFTIMPANQATNPITVAGAIKNLKQTGNLDGGVPIPSYKLPDDLKGLSPQAQQELARLTPENRDYVEKLIRSQGVEETNRMIEEVAKAGPQSTPYQAGPDVGRLEQAPSSKQLKGENLVEKFPQGTQRIFKAGGNLEGVNPKLIEVLKEASKDLPPGYRVNMISGKDARSSGTKNHPGGVAMDVEIVGPDGRTIPNQGFGEGHKVYEQLAQSMDIRGKQMYPGTNYIWGGAWKSDAAGYGDRMHYQIVDPEMPVPGASKGSGAYNFESGINPNFPEASAYMPPEELQAYKEQIAQRYQQEQEQLRLAQEQPQAPPTAALAEQRQEPVTGTLPQPKQPDTDVYQLPDSDVVPKESPVDIKEKQMKKDVYGPTQDTQSSSGGFWSWLGFAKGGETDVGSDQDYFYVGPKPFIPERLRASTTAYTLDNQGVYDTKGNLLFTKRRDENIRKLENGRIRIDKKEENTQGDELISELPLQQSKIKEAEDKIPSFAFGGETDLKTPAGGISGMTASEQMTPTRHTEEMQTVADSSDDEPKHGMMQTPTDLYRRDGMKTMSTTTPSPSQTKYVNFKVKATSGGINTNVTGNKTYLT